MTSQELIQKIILRIGKFKWLILAGGVCCAVLLYLYASRIPVVYSVRSTLYPNSPSAGSSSSSLSDLLTGGGSNATKNLSDDASISIEEVAKSMKTRLAVSEEKIPDLGNKTVAQLVIENYNRTRSYLAPAIPVSKPDSNLFITGASLLGAQYSVKFTKTGLLEVNYISTDQDVLIPVSYILINKITQFYKELKIEKAKSDYDFIQKKLDSLEDVLSKFDRKQIIMNNTTMFVPDNKLQYSIPKQNLQNDRARVMSQRNGAASNREEALWRLQKVTPVIQLLDRPARPFTQIQPPKVIYATGGFFLGCIVILLICVSGLLYKYINGQINNAIFKDKDENINTTTTA